MLKTKIGSFTASDLFHEIANRRRFTSDPTSYEAIGFFERENKNDNSNDNSEKKLIIKKLKRRKLYTRVAEEWEPGKGRGGFYRDTMRRRI